MKCGEVAPIAGTARRAAFQLSDGEIAVDQDIARIADRAARRNAGDTRVLARDLLDDDGTLDF